MNDLAEAGIRLVDEAHFSWSLATLECEDALDAWRRAHPAERRGANVAYRAALDREEAAARELERLAALVALTLGRKGRAKDNISKRVLKPTPARAAEQLAEREQTRFRAA